MVPKYFIIIFLIFPACLMGCQGQQESAEIELSELTVSEIHAAYQEGRYNAEQLAGAYLDRIEALDGKLNAITYINSRALERARNLERSTERHRI